MGIYSYQDHYRKLSFFASILLFAECFALGISQKAYLPSVVKKHSANKYTRQRNSLLSVLLLHSVKKLFAECSILTLDR